MTKDPEKKQIGARDKEHISHEQALDEISRKVDEKLSQMTGAVFDQEMERRLAELKELRRQEKEALERSRNARRQKRRKGTERKKSDKQVPKEEKSDQTGETGEPRAKGKRKKPISGHSETLTAAAGDETKKDEEQLALAVDLFFDSAEALAAEEEKKSKDSFLSQITLFLKSKKGAGSRDEKSGRKQRREPGLKPVGVEERETLGKSQPQEEKDLISEQERLQEKERDGKQLQNQGQDPDRKLDRSIDAVFTGVQGALKKTAVLSRDLHLTRKDMQGESHLTHEKRMARYAAVWARHLEPVGRKLQILNDWVQIRLAQLTDRLEKAKENGKVRLSLFQARAGVWIEKGCRKAFAAFEFAEQHKLKIFACFAGAVVCAGVVGIIIGHLTAYEYMYNGRVLGVVKDQELVYKTIDIIGGKLSESLDADIEIDKENDISFRKIMGWGLTIDSKDDVLNSLTYMSTLKAKGYVIVADGKQLAVLQSRKVAESILEGIMAQFSRAKEGVEYKSVGFAQDVEIEEIDTELGNIQNQEEVTQYLLTGAVEKKVHVVQKGETFNAIAKSYGLKPSELQASNPDVIPDKLKIDQELILTQDSPVLTVQTTEIATYNEEIPFEITYEDSSAYYEGEKEVKQKGVNGQREVVAEIVRNNGTEVSRTELSSKTLSEPTGQIVLVGTKEKPKTVATGSFSYPVRGARLSSRFGTRWGRAHTGIDLACSTGTTISAADGGTVTFAGYKGSYGYLVIIDHGNGKETYYAHCSKLLVSSGTKVYKGQAIARVGSTGRSTGPHLHFEVRVNGVAKNPLNYL